MAIDLAGRPIAITGASSGIGAATALACAAAGMPVALGARRTEMLEAVAARIRGAGGRAFVFRMDVTDAAQAAGFVEAAAAEFGGLYAVYANAGIGLEAPVAEMTDAAMRDIFEINFFGSLNVIRPALGLMARNPGPHRGHVLLCSSCVARMALPYYGAYSATKSAQHHIGRAMRMELHPQGIHVSTVHPVGTRTEFFDNVKAKNGKLQLVDHTPDRLMQSPETVARATVRCLRRPRAEVWTSTMVRLGMAVCAALPGVEDWAMRRMVRQRLARAAERAVAAAAAGERA